LDRQPLAYEVRALPVELSGHLEPPGNRTLIGGLRIHGSTVELEAHRAHLHRVPVITAIRMSKTLADLLGRTALSTLSRPTRHSHPQALRLHTARWNRTSVSGFGDQGPTTDREPYSLLPTSSVPNEEAGSLSSPAPKSQVLLESRSRAVVNRGSGST
jgi:hypothetical protein